MASRVSQNRSPQRRCKEWDVFSTIERRRVATAVASIRRRVCERLAGRVGAGVRNDPSYLWEFNGADVVKKPKAKADKVGLSTIRNPATVKGRRSSAYKNGKIPAQRGRMSTGKR